MLAVAATAFAQRPEVRAAPEDDLRRDMHMAQEAYLAANPNIEEDLTTAAVGQLRRQIAQSRELALKYTSAKVKYYEHLIGGAASDLDRLQSSYSPNPDVVERQIQANKERRQIIGEEVDSAKSQVSALKDRLATAPPAHHASIQTDLEQASEHLQILERLAALIVGENVQLRSIKDTGEAVTHGRNELINARREQVEAYRRLHHIAETGGIQYGEYFDALDRFVRERDLKERRRGK